ncbi:MAG: hypothetical protein U1E05_05040, partial [Patescibacteria group bacterium]|nr:hypothetical protein [Patescibacteria group bacterium]
VVYRRHLTREHIVRLATLVQRYGAHELRIHQPPPRGQLADSQEAEGIFYNEDDVARLNDIQFALNSAGGDFLKISAMSHTQGPCKFGCGAGVLHSYVSATGELWPCEFVPLSFGNVLREDFAEVYAQMVDAVGIPKNYCWACKLSGELANRRLPLGRAESHALARADRSSTYPQFFRDLQSVPIGVPPRNDVGTLTANVYAAAPVPQRGTPALTT